MSRFKKIKRKPNTEKQLSWDDINWFTYVYCLFRPFYFIRLLRNELKKGGTSSRK